LIKLLAQILLTFDDGMTKPRGTAGVHEQQNLAWSRVFASEQQLADVAAAVALVVSVAVAVVVGVVGVVVAAADVLVVPVLLFHQIPSASYDYSASSQFHFENS
jgi:tryptophan-rich sensory protein